MKRAMVLMAALAAVGTMVAADLADARRLGGGRSLGAQRQSVAPQPATPTAPPTAAPSANAAATATPPGAAANPVMPARPGAAAPAKPATPAAAPAASGASRWLAPIAGLAAGLGLAALLSHFGLSEEFGSLLLLLLLVGGAVFVLRMLVARRAVPSRPLQYAGGAGSTGVRDDVRAGASSSGAPRIEPAFSPAPAAGAGRFPPGFDAEAFVRNAKQQFIALQAAHDAADRKALRDVMTPKLYAEITKDLPEAGTQRPTEVVTLDADVLEVATEGNEHWASVRYSGTLREDGSAVPASFDEVWHLTKPIDGSSGWLLAGIQQRN